MKTRKRRTDALLRWGPMPLSRLRIHLALPAVLVAFLAACGATPRPEDAQTSEKQPPPEAQLLYVWRNFEETGIPEEMTIYTDGELRYRNLLHTQRSIPVLSGRIAPSRLTRIRRALDALDLSHVDASGVKPRRSGYRYVIRSRGRVGTAADGHLVGPIRPLVLELRAQMDHLRQRSL
jgi:hypothetical protein